MDFNTLYYTLYMDFDIIHDAPRMDSGALHYTLCMDSNGHSFHYIMLSTWARMDFDTIYYALYMYFDGV